jgi:hypothetical protein
MSKIPHAKTPAAKAGMICAMIPFRKYVRHRLDLPAMPNREAAAEFVRRECQVESRSDLNNDAAAAARFDALCTTFDQWRGRIATPTH